MKYFKNTELAKLLHVSEKSIRNWIDAAQSGKLDIQLYPVGDKVFIANTPKNSQYIESLVEKGKKYKNRRGHKIIEPTKKFYQAFSREQISDIISHLTIRHETPLKYSYFDGGAHYWDTFEKRLLDEKTPNLLNGTIGLLDANLHDLDYYLGSHKKINVVDLGPGNALPIKKLLEHLVEEDRLNRYIAIDISKEMLQIAENNINEWFGSRVKYEGYVRDFDHERFSDLISKDYDLDENESPINLVLLLGGTLSNFRTPDRVLHSISDSLGANDVFIYSTKLDTPNSRRYFDFNVMSPNEELSPRHRLVIDLLNIDKSLYEVNQWFDEDKQARFISIKLKTDVSLKFRLPDGDRIVSLNKNDSILLWRYWHQSALETITQFDECDLDLLQAAKSKNQEYLLLISKIKTEQ